MLVLAKGTDHYQIIGQWCNRFAISDDKSEVAATGLSDDGRLKKRAADALLQSKLLTAFLHISCRRHPRLCRLSRSPLCS